MISHLHHINFIVHDLDQAVERYQHALGLGDFIYGTLNKRGVVTARIKIGETWLVLVQPTDLNSKPGKYLEKHGEGFFLLSFGTDNINDILNKLEQTSSKPPIEKRQGLENWQVVDFPEDLFFGAHFQLTEESTN